MLNINNYFQKNQTIEWTKLPEALAKGNKLVEAASQNNWDAYKSNTNIKRVVDAYCKKLDEYLTKNPNSAKPPQKATPVKSNKPNPEISTTKQKKEKPKNNDTAVEVELLYTDIIFIKRYAAMNGKVKTQAQILTFIHSLQKAILERRIKKVSAYAKEVETIQNQLISCYENMGDMVEIKIDSKNLKRYLEIANSQKGMLSINLIKAYVALNGKKDVKDKAKRLLNRFTKTVKQGKITEKDKYAITLNEIYKTLKRYISENSTILNINKAQLNGLLGIIDENLFDQKKSLKGHNKNIIINSNDILSMDFKTIGFTGKYKNLIGDPSIGFTAMVFGLPKSGKSTICLDFANYLAENHGKVLYCAIEEGLGYTLKEKIERLKAHHSNLFITDRVPENIKDFNFVFIDSVSKAGMDIKAIDQIRKMHPEISFIFIYHTTKEGNFKGANEHAHEVDVIIQVEKGKATSTGRFNSGGSMEL